MNVNEQEILIVKQFVDGSLTAFDELYHRYHNAVLANIIKLVIQTEAAEDILQEVFIALWENREKIDIDKPVGGWLFVVSYNKSLSFLKKAVKEKNFIASQISESLIAEETNNEKESIESLKLSFLNEAINQLSPRKKEVFNLCRFQGKSYKEVAEILKISPDTVKEYMVSSTKFIKDYLLSKSQLTTSVAGLGLFISYLQR